MTKQTKGKLIDYTKIILIFLLFLTTAYIGHKDIHATVFVFVGIFVGFGGGYVCYREGLFSKC